MKEKKVTILQSNYLPWKGYFDIINMVDLFIFYEDIQYTKNDWRNRNKIKTHKGLEWLTVPCGNNIKRLVCEVELKDHASQKKHCKTILNNYQKAEYFIEYKQFFEDFYLKHNWVNLSEMNQYLIKHIAHEFLGMATEFVDSREYKLQNSQKSERVLELLKKSGATEYVSGPAAKSYLDPEEFRRRGINLVWMDYSGYKEYNQLYPPFVHDVSIIDLLMNEGPNARNFLKSTG
jgi:hypothetical protein